MGWSPLKIDQCECVGRSPVKIDHCERCGQVALEIIQDNEIISFCFLYKAYYAKHRGVLLRKHYKEGASVVTQFLTHFFDKIFGKSKNSEKQRKSKKICF